MKKRYTLFIVIFLIFIVIFLFIRLSLIRKNENIVLSNDVKQFELLENIVNSEFGNSASYNIILDNSFYYNFITNTEYPNEVMLKIKTLERINMGVEENYTLSLKYYNNCLTIVNEIKENKEKHVVRFHINVNGDKITYVKDKLSFSEYE